MTCHKCGHVFSACEHAIITDTDVSGYDELDVQVECPKRDSKHYTFIKTADLVTDD